ncbi:hypothetical protein BD626DRAFT_487396 [Schizophyllum amplum]|uniref:Uncharacterized protein n=1 Tax=Schizophyllum amplum TaxID=97359 RepID=A0A550CND8_9AGAR|nr:hypothetical protein BD626DRAFT_487396 [Auriculariopsis ampla]
MMSVLAPGPVPQLSTETRPASSPSTVVDEMGRLEEALEPFAQRIVRTGYSSVRLQCMLPSWSGSSESCFDLHDLHKLRTRFLVFIHDLLQSLRASGVYAVYSLAPSNASSYCMISVQAPGFCGSPYASAPAAVEKLNLINKSTHVFLADLDNGPCLIMH